MHLWFANVLVKNVRFLCSFAMYWESKQLRFRIQGSEFGDYYSGFGRLWGP